MSPKTNIIVVTSHSLNPLPSVLFVACPIEILILCLHCDKNNNSRIELRSINGYPTCSRVTHKNIIGANTSDGLKK